MERDKYEEAIEILEELQSPIITTPSERAALEIAIAALREKQQREKEKADA